jgi:hypothetical protein
MKKRGTLGTIGTLVLIIITIIVVVAVFKPKISSAANSFFSLFGIGEEAGTGTDKPTPLQEAESTFNNFYLSYVNCKNYKSNDCLCDEFDVNQIPEGYSIKLENLAGKTRIELYGFKPTPEGDPKVIDNDNLCFYEYDKNTRTFSKIDADEVILNPEEGNNPYKIGNKAQLFKFDQQNICFVSGTYESKNFDEITQLKPKCSLAQAGTTTGKTGILDLGDYTGDYPYNSFVQSKDKEALKIIGDLKTLLLNNIGPVTGTTEEIDLKQNRLERRTNTFSDAYTNFDKNKDGLINDDAYLISIRGLQLQSKNSQIKHDYFKVHYLGSSDKSRILAKNIKSKLEELNGTLIFNDKEVSKAEAGEGYRFDFTVMLEDNSKTNVGPVFLACEGDYKNFAACKENTLIPAVFIDVVEVIEEKDNHNIFEGHSGTIAKAIYEGVKEYLP